MTREIKFRAWDGEKMVDTGTLNDTTMGGYQMWDGDKHEYYPVMQYTGLRDKNGKEIYEGDIVVSKYSVSRKGESVEYNAPSFTLHGKNGIDDYWSPITEGDEIIGNVYENPDLVK